jgi:NAD(P)H dehydrogenase (quinone)
MPDFTNQTLLVTGASGHLARIAIDHLLANGAKHVIAGTRDVSKVADLKARGVEIRQLDFDDAASMAAAFAGVDRVLLVSTDAVGKRLAQQTGAVAAAAKAGVKHIVYTSAPNASPSTKNALSNEHYWTEQALVANGTDWTVLRNHLYADLNLMSAGPAIASGKLYDATEGRGRAYVTRADTARAAAGALLKLEGKSILDVTGPEALTQAQIAGLFSKLSGKPVERVGLTGEQLREGLKAAGLPDMMAALLVDFDLDAAKGYHAIVTDVVRDLSGREPQSLAAFLEENKAALAA